MRFRTTVSKARLRLMDGMVRTRGMLTRGRGSAATGNVFHCCLHKTGSQWIKRILADPEVFRRTGLRTYQYQAEMPGGHDPRPVDQRSFSEPFPARTIVSPIYIDYGNYREIPKPESTRAFFVTRDPRDLVVSWYFSQRYSHGLMGDMGEVRGTLAELEETEGLIYAIRHLDDFGVFCAQRSWLNAIDDPTTMVVRFEDLIGPEATGWYLRIFQHCGFDIDQPTIERLLDRYAFERLSGRSRGTEDVFTHFRKGVAGDWRNHFDDRVIKAFYEVTGDLTSVLGYESV